MSDEPGKARPVPFEVLERLTSYGELVCFRAVWAAAGELLTPSDIEHATKDTDTPLSRKTATQALAALAAKGLVEAFQPRDKRTMYGTKCEVTSHLKPEAKHSPGKREESSQTEHKWEESSHFESDKVGTNFPLVITSENKVPTSLSGASENKVPTSGENAQKAAAAKNGTGNASSNGRRVKEKEESFSPFELTPPNAEQDSPPQAADPPDPVQAVYAQIRSVLGYAKLGGSKAQQSEMSELARDLVATETPVETLVRQLAEWKADWHTGKLGTVRHKAWVSDIRNTFEMSVDQRANPTAPTDAARGHGYADRSEREEQRLFQNLANQREREQAAGARGHTDENLSQLFSPPAHAGYAHDAGSGVGGGAARDSDRGAPKLLRGGGQGA